MTTKQKQAQEKIRVYDTTLRDGTQGEGISLSLDDKLRIAVRLDQFGVDYIEGGWPGSNPKDINFFEEIKKQPIKTAKVVAFGSTRRKNKKPQEDFNLECLLNAKTPAITIFGKTWDLHVTDVFNVSLKENLAMISDSVAFLKSKKREVVYDAEHFFDGFRANPDYALQTVKAAVEAGADWIVLCDTNGGSMPHQVREAIAAFKQQIKTPFGIHCHNDMNLAVANSVEAVLHGATQVQGTINGIGERCGNADLVSIIPILSVKLGLNCFTPKQLKDLTPMSRFTSELCNMPVQNNEPFVGSSAFAHKGGVHIDAMVKNSITYEHMDPALLGNQRKFLISELSGRTNILAKAQQFNVDLSKESPETNQILTRIGELEKAGYQFEAAEASFELLMKKMTGKFKPSFELITYKVMDMRDAGQTAPSEAMVEVQVGGQKEHTAAHGDGPVNALDNALRRALKRFYPQVEQIRLTDYKVRVVNSEEGTAAKVRVFIQFQDEKHSWQTVGVSENIIEASWIALVDAIEYKLHKA